MENLTACPLDILIVEDSEDDALLETEELRLNGFEVSWSRVETGQDMRLALARQQWHLILADHHLPGFSALEAFEIYRQSGLDIPFIIVSGAIGEEAAVRAMKEGVHDYVSKDRLARLGPAVRRELRDAGNRKEHLQNQSALKAAYAELAAIHAKAPVVLAVVDEDLRVAQVNELAARLTGGNVAQMLGCRPGHIFGCLTALNNPAGCGHGLACDRCTLRLTILDTVRNGKQHEQVEANLPLAATAGPNSRWFLISSTLITSDTAKRALICAQDITELKRTEEALRGTVRQLQSALAEKTVLLKEVHHRVRNNLAVISSLLGMRADATSHPEARLALEESRQRVGSMALIHELLYGSEHLGRINVAEYASQLVAELYATFVVDPEQIIAEVEPGTLELGVDQAVPCALILNELVTNAFKYAFPNGRRGSIGVSCHEVSPGTVQLVVHDNGVGLPKDPARQRPDSLGMAIVRILVRQLGATLAVQDQDGARFEITFPHAAQSPAA